MKVCPHAKNCALFPKFKTEIALSIWKRVFCEEDYENCERYKISLSGKEPPPDMLPNGKTLS